jgi:hypothetical protein
MRYPWITDSETTLARLSLTLPRLQVDDQAYYCSAHCRYSVHAQHHYQHPTCPSNIHQQLGCATQIVTCPDRITAVCNSSHWHSVHHGSVVFCTSYSTVRCATTSSHMWHIRVMRVAPPARRAWGGGVHPCGLPMRHPFASGA